MNRKVDGLIFLGCFAIIVLTITKFSIAMADNEKKSDEKAELAADAVKDKRMRRGGYFFFGGTITT